MTPTTTAKKMKSNSEDSGISLMENKPNVEMILIH